MIDETPDADRHRDADTEDDDRNSASDAASSLSTQTHESLDRDEELLAVMLELLDEITDQKRDLLVRADQLCGIGVQVDQASDRLAQGLFNQAADRLLSAAASMMGDAGLICDGSNSASEAPAAMAATFLRRLAGSISADDITREMLVVLMGHGRSPDARMAAPLPRLMVLAGTRQGVAAAGFTFHLGRTVRLAQAALEPGVTAPWSLPPVLQASYAAIAQAQEVDEQTQRMALMDAEQAMHRLTERLQEEEPDDEDAGTSDFMSSADEGGEPLPGLGAIQMPEWGPRIGNAIFQRVRSDWSAHPLPGRDVAALDALQAQPAIRLFFDRWIETAGLYEHELDEGRAASHIVSGARVLAHCGGGGPLADRIGELIEEATSTCGNRMTLARWNVESLIEDDAQSQRAGTSLAHLRDLALRHFRGAELDERARRLAGEVYQGEWAPHAEEVEYILQARNMAVARDASFIPGSPLPMRNTHRELSEAWLEQQLQEIRLLEGSERCERYICNHPMLLDRFHAKAPAWATAAIAHADQVRHAVALEYPQDAAAGDDAAVRAEKAAAKAGYERRLEAAQDGYERMRRAMVAAVVCNDPQPACRLNAEQYPAAAAEINRLRQPGVWNIQAGDLVPATVVQLPEWPAHRGLVIHDVRTRHTTRYDPQGHESHDIDQVRPDTDVVLLRSTLDGGAPHYDVGRPEHRADGIRWVRSQRIAGDGDCLIRALLYAEPALARGRDARQMLRHRLADHMLLRLHTYRHHFSCPAVREPHASTAIEQDPPPSRKRRGTRALDALQTLQAARPLLMRTHDRMQASSRQADQISLENKAAVQACRDIRMEALQQQLTQWDQQRIAAQERHDRERQRIRQAHSELMRQDAEARTSTSRLQPAPSDACALPGLVTTPAVAGVSRAAPAAVDQRNSLAPTRTSAGRTLTAPTPAPRLPQLPPSRQGNASHGPRGGMSR